MPLLGLLQCAKESSKTLLGLFLCLAFIDSSSDCFGAKSSYPSLLSTYSVEVGNSFLSSDLVSSPKSDGVEYLKGFPLDSVEFSFSDRSYKGRSSL